MEKVASFHIGFRRLCRAQPPLYSMLSKYSIMKATEALFCFENFSARRALPIQKIISGSESKHRYKPLDSMTKAFQTLAGHPPITTFLALQNIFLSWPSSGKTSHTSFVKDSDLTHIYEHPT